MKSIFARVIDTPTTPAQPSTTTIAAMKRKNTAQLDMTSIPDAPLGLSGENAKPAGAFLGGG